MSTKRLFGTDGVRGLANADPMTAETALKLGMAAGHYFKRGARRHTVVIGKDTRLSGYLLEPALTAGFIAVGMDVVIMGPIPTPGIAMLTRSLRADLGVMISASHNPFEDNGIKLFGPDGFKLSDSIEDEIEALMSSGGSALRAEASKLGRTKRLEDAAGRYIEFTKGTFPRGQRLDGLKLVVDCANGAAYKMAPSVFWELGADVVKVGVDPDGFNINRNCGSTHPDRMRELVVSHNANLGIALDGDADRVLFCDEHGDMIDGDQVLGVIAESWKKRGELTGDTVVATVMSNLGLERRLNSLGIALNRTKVGDRYVVEEMRRGGFNLGGEQSGHIVMGSHATTGDGIIAALQVLAALVDSGRTASQTLRVFSPVPQKLKNVRLANGADPDKVLAITAVKSAIALHEKRLEGRGRILIRKSGTEPLIRVMVEGDDATEVDATVGSLVQTISQAAG